MCCPTTYPVVQAACRLKPPVMASMSSTSPAKKKGRKAIFIAKGSVHAMAYRDHHEEYTRIVKDFVSKEE